MNLKITEAKKPKQKSLKQKKPKQKNRNKKIGLNVIEFCR